MWRCRFTGLAAILAALIVAFVAAPPALAYPGFTMTTNNSSAPVATQGTITFQAKTQSFYLRTYASWSYVSCGASTNSSFGGSMKRGVYTTPALATVTTTHFGTATSSGSTVTPGTAPCLGPGGAATSITRYGAWSLGIDLASDPESPTPVADQLTQLVLSNVRLRVNLGTCSFDIGGPDTRTSPVPALYRTSSASPGTQLAGIAPAYLVNSAGKSTYETGTPAASLMQRVWNTSDPNGCSGGTVKNGTQIGISGSFAVSAVSPATDAIWVSA